MTYFRDQFPVLRGGVYLDVAFKAAVPDPVVRAIAAFYAGVQHDGGDKGGWTRTVAAAREKIARLIAARPGEIAFVKNASEGMNLLAHGLRYSAGDNVIISDQEHETNEFPWTNLERRGLEVRRVPSRDLRFDIEDVAALVDSRTRVVSLAHVYPVSGFVPEVAAVGRLCRERGLYFFLDAVQSVGALSTDVRALGVHALATSGHKWLLGPYGAGFLYASPEFMQEAEPVFASKHYTASHGEELNTARRQDASRWEYGSLNYSGIAALEAGVDMILAVGPQRIEARIRELVMRLRQRAEEEGLEVASPPADGGAVSGVVSLRVPNAERVADRLRGQRIFVSARRGLLRASVDFYNNEEDIDAFVAAVAGRPFVLRREPDAEFQERVS
ncbi:MAG: aminotransferase class V-fold PLP-dependent enzyme [Gemmatimonadetes bacterium]|nr:aminotransferase class V-fold PLP-dependent enzyme [Gemmatimonadota bacterium]